MWTDFQNSFTRWFARKFSLYTSQRLPPHLQYVATLPCESQKSKKLLTLTAPQQTVDMFLRTFWGLDLIFNSSSTVCLKTADPDWLTNILKFVRWHLKSTAEPHSVQHCCIMTIFTMIFALPSFWVIFHMLYTYLSKIISAIFLW